MRELTPYTEPTLPPELVAEPMSLISAHEPVAAMRRMEGATRLPPDHCQVWVLERVELEKWYQDLWLPPVPCPYCGELLKTPRAQQCLSCGMDWHDLVNVVRLGSRKDEKGV
jgi:hypothetical protein